MNKFIYLTKGTYDAYYPFFYVIDTELSYEEVEMVLIGNHGPFAWGKTAAKAVYNSKVLEVIAEMAHFTLQINPNAPRLKDSLIKKHYERKHGKDSYYGQ
jgi:L-ribulose-5-phosphate 4-epimerase